MKRITDLLVEQRILIPNPAVFPVFCLLSLQNEDNNEVWISKIHLQFLKGTSLVGLCSGTTLDNVVDVKKSLVIVLLLEITAFKQNNKITLYISV